MGSWVGKFLFCTWRKLNVLMLKRISITPSKSSSDARLHLMREKTERKACACKIAMAAREIGNQGSEWFAKSEGTVHGCHFMADFKSTLLTVTSLNTQVKIFVFSLLSFQTFKVYFTI